MGMAKIPTSISREKVTWDKKIKTISKYNK